METIDFRKNIYYSKIAFSTKTNNSMAIYKVANLYEDKYVYFTLLDDWYYDYYYPYYPDELSSGNSTIFEVCNNKTNFCQRHVKIYYFEKNVEYTIKIHYLKGHYYSYNSEYYNPQYIFFPITNNNFKQINSDDSGIFF